MPEALMCGTPVAAFGGGGIPEIAERIGNPYWFDLCEPGDLDELADAVAALLHHGRCPDGFAKAVAQEFSAVAMTRRFEELLLQYVERRLSVQPSEVT